MFPTSSSPKIDQILQTATKKKAVEKSRLSCFFPGVSFDTSLSYLISQISTAMMVFVHGAESFINDASNDPESLVPNLSCDSASDQQDSQETRWTLGESFHK